MEVQEEVIQDFDCQTAEWHNVFLLVCFQSLEEKEGLIAVSLMVGYSPSTSTKHQI
ncbi:hypothetical protein [Methanosarcina barkeri]|uniref:hypothetical protein n=1 Tax=Methanosarcina barkeri TaxID=2208 RepID=UPI0012D438DB|nr:hypothetical protein [Methanosarcina barkeri]